MIKLKSTSLIEPREPVRSIEWLPDNVTMPKGTETGGLPFDVAAFPHVDGVLEAFDDPDVRTIPLQWATRLGKTTTVLSLFAQTAATNPRNMMVSCPTKESAGRVVVSRLYPILECTDGVSNQLGPPSRRSMFHVKLDSCRIYVGWSGSPESLADVGAWFGLANEIDKWDDSASSEADSLALFLNRFKGFPNHKIILESTPTIKGRSRIEKAIQQSRRHLRYVPCPLCGHYQPLVSGSEDSIGGIKWDRLENGQSDPVKAAETAYYECRQCRGRIENHHRTTMLRSGVWCPDGCTVSDDGTLQGQPLQKSKESMGFGPLPSWYALTETWGGFPSRILKAKKPKDLQDVINSYCAETFEIRKTKSTPERVAERLAGSSSRGIVPVGVEFLTVTVDMQAADGGFVKWVVLGHCRDESAKFIDYGIDLTLTDIWDSVIRRQYSRQSGGAQMTPILSAVDSGWNTKEVYDFCNSRNAVIPCKGSSTDMGGKPHKLAEVETGENKGQLLLTVNTDFWETELQARLDERLPSEFGSLELCVDATRDIGLLTELCNGILTDKVDNRGNAKLIWIKKDEGVPNDFRDATRYGLALADVIRSSGVSFADVVPHGGTQERTQFVRSSDNRRSGWVRRRGN